MICMTQLVIKVMANSWMGPVLRSNSYESYDPVKDACVQKIKAAWIPGPVEK